MYLLKWIENPIYIIPGLSSTINIEQRLYQGVTLKLFSWVSKGLTYSFFLHLKIKKPFKFTLSFDWLSDKTIWGTAQGLNVFRLHGMTSNIRSILIFLWSGHNSSYPTAPQSTRATYNRLRSLSFCIIIILLGVKGHYCHRVHKGKLSFTEPRLGPSLRFDK